MTFLVFLETREAFAIPAEAEGKESTPQADGSRSFYTQDSRVSPWNGCGVPELTVLKEPEHGPQ